jgi:aryl-alcohol dehydrogenase-like predicted oxidoreductase
MLIAGNETEGIGLGTAQFAFRDRTTEDSVATVHAALDAGVMLIDTALAYTRPGVESYAEQVVARALRGLTTGRPLVATKGGHWRRGDSFPVDGRPGTCAGPGSRWPRSWMPTGSTCTSCTTSTRRCRCPTASAPSGSCGRKARSRLSGCLT